MTTTLIVDDQLAMRNMFKHILEKAGYECTLAVDGLHAWGIAERKDFDLIITDFYMPKMNGIELCAKLRSSERHKFTPILVVSTESNKTKKSEGKAAGASGWIVKPIKSDVLLPALRRLVA